MPPKLDIRIVRGKPRMIVRGRKQPPPITGFVSPTAPICTDIARRVVDRDPKVVISDRLKTALGDMLRQHQAAITISQLEDCNGPRELYPWQRVGAHWLATVERGILADEMGAGKTATAIDAAMSVDASFGVIICSDGKRQDWIDELKRWGGITATSLEGSFTERDAILADWRGFLVCNYNIAALHDEQLAQADLVILDEAHKIRNRKAGFFESVQTIARGARWMFALTGEPVVNSATDLWPLLNLCDGERFASFWSFAHRFHEVTDNGFGLDVGRTIKPEEEKAFRRLIEPYVLRRERPHDVKVKHREVVYRLPPAQRGLYNQMFETDAATHDGLTVEADVTVAKITRLRQLALHPRLCLPNYEGPSKLDILFDLLAKRPRKTVVFSTYEELLRLAEERLDNEGCSVVLISGNVPARRREEELREFREGDAEVLLATFGVGGEGLNLVEAVRVIMLDLAWHPAGNRQAQGRIVRIGQKAKKVDVIAIRAEDTIEDDIWDIIAEKETVTVEKLLERMT